MIESVAVDLETMAKERGIDLFGVADLTNVQDFICEQGGEYLRTFPRAVSIGIHLLDAVVDELFRHEELAVLYSYGTNYTTVNSLLDQIALLLAKRLQDTGYRAYPIAASQTINRTKFIGVFSHKLAANLAGLGWIGKSCLLITPDYGPRVRFATILTDAPLKAGSMISGRCGDCEECVSICPVSAFTGASFDPSEPREVRFNPELHRAYSKEREEKLGIRRCGLCVYICPHGRAS